MVEYFNEITRMKVCNIFSSYLQCTCNKISMHEVSVKHSQFYLLRTLFYVLVIAPKYRVSHRLPHHSEYYMKPLFKIIIT